MGKFADWYRAAPRVEAWEEELRRLVGVRDIPRDPGTGRFAPASPAADEPEYVAAKFSATSYTEPAVAAPSGSDEVPEAIERSFLAIARALGEVKAARTDIAREEGYSDEGVAALTAFMHARHLTNVAAAIPEFERENPPGEMVTGGGSRHALPPARSSRDGAAPELALLFEGDDQAWLDRTIPLALREARGR